MKNFIKFLGVAFFAASIFTFNACSSDDEVIIDVVEGINVSDGLYLAQVGSDPEAGALLSTESVDAPDFQSQARTGFVGGYIYLEAGDYNLVQVTNKEVTNTWGGSVTQETDEGSQCDYNTYNVASMEENGAAISVSESGLYRVANDQLRSEMIFYQIYFPGIIGTATPGGWSEETSLNDGSVTAEGGSWSRTDVVLREGEWKVRFNCRWALDRKIDPLGGLEESNGYIMFNNFGGSVDNLTNGNDQPNIVNSEDGTYTVTITWNSLDGWQVTLDRTGDAPVLTFDPNDYNLGVIGDATAGSWDSDRDMLYKLDGTTHKWVGVVTLADAGNFKIRANDAWDFNLGGTLAADGETVTLSEGGSDIPTPGAGQYYIVVSTDDEGDTWQASMTANGWGVIGDATADGWDADQDMTADGFDAGVTTYTYLGTFGTGQFKFRAGDDWAMNLGGDLGALTFDGNNIEIATAGDYLVTLTFDGSTYMTTIEAQ